MSDQPPQDSFEVKLTIGEEAKAQFAQGGLAVAIAEALALDPANPAHDEAAERALATQREFTARAKQIDQMRLDFVKPAREILDRAQANFMPTINALNGAVDTIKTKLLAWQQGKQKIAAAAQAKAEAEARKIREEAEKKAAQERAAAEEREREAKAKAEQEERERARLAAEAEAQRRAGNAIEAAALDRKARLAAQARAEQEEKERLAREDGERKAREAQAKADAEARALTEAARAGAPSGDLKGFGGRENWIVELAPGKTVDDATLEISMAIVGVERTNDKAAPLRFVKPRLELLSLLTVDLSQAKKTAKAQKNHTSIPGYVARNDPTAVTRKA